jgi:hypothetical protein
MIRNSLRTRQTLGASHTFLIESVSHLITAHTRETLPGWVESFTQNHSISKSSQSETLFSERIKHLSPPTLHS